MKVILSKKESRILDEMLINLDNHPLEDVPGIVSVTYSNDETTIEINEKYVTTMGGEINKWLPSLIGTTKGLVSIIQLCYQSLTATEKSLDKELKTKEKKTL